jgi:hypothetical protein
LLPSLEKNNPDGIPEQQSIKPNGKTVKIMHDITLLRVKVKQSMFLSSTL